MPDAIFILKGIKPGVKGLSVLVIEKCFGLWEYKMNKTEMEKWGSSLEEIQRMNKTGDLGCVVFERVSDKILKLKEIRG